MENRLHLNKKPEYILPDEVIVDEYKRMKTGDYVPSFTPDIALTAFGSIRIKKPKATNSQIWIKTNNKELLNFIKEYDWESKLNKITNAYSLGLWKFKKILLEEFYKK